MADEGASSDPLPNQGMNVKTKGMIAVGGAVATFLAWLFAAAALPRWWSHRIGDAVDGGTAWGGVLGALVGFLFTLIPLGVLRLVFRRHRAWKKRGLIALGALVLAAPNLMTLGIVMGNGSGAHAGERTLDVEGPGFRGGSLVGALLAVLAAAGLWWLLRSRRTSRRDVGRLRDEIRSRDDASSDA